MNKKKNELIINKNTTILVTGAAGFIGFYLVKRLLSELGGARIVCMDNFNDYYDPRLKEWRAERLEEISGQSRCSYVMIRGDISDKVAIDSLFERYRPDIVVHLAAQAGVRYSIVNPDSYIQSNLIGFYNILEACRHSYDGTGSPAGAALQAGMVSQDGAVSQGDDRSQTGMVSQDGAVSQGDDRSQAGMVSQDGAVSQGDDRSQTGMVSQDGAVSQGDTGTQNDAGSADYSGVKHLVFASSSSVYGGNKKIPFSTDDRVDFPVSLYAATKKCDELLAHCYSKLYGIPSTGLRFFTVYGPAGRPDMAYFSFTEKLRRGEKIKVFNYGDCKRDFTYVDDIIEGVYRVMTGAPVPETSGEEMTGAPMPETSGEKMTGAPVPETSREEKMGAPVSEISGEVMTGAPVPGALGEEMTDAPVPETSGEEMTDAPYSVYNIGGGQPVSLMDFIRILSEELIGAGVLSEGFKIEDYLELVPMQPGDVPVTYADSSGLYKDYGFKPCIELREGLRKFAAWYRDYN